MRILVLIHEFPPVGGGGGRVAQDLCQGLVKRGHEVRVLTAQCGDLPNHEERDSILLLRLRSGRSELFRADLKAMLGFVWASFWEGLRQIRSWKPDIIHVHFAVPTGVSAYLLNLFTNVPYVITAHLGDVPGGVPEKTGKWFRWIFPLTPSIWRHAAGIAAVSAFTRDLALNSYDVPIEVIHNGVDLNALDPGEIMVGNPPQVVFAGRFMLQKNLLQLVRSLVAVQDLPWACTLIGDGPLRAEVETEIAHQNLGDRFTLTGWMTPDQVIEQYRQSDLLFMPSLSEGLPVVGVQAMAMGLALVLSRVGGCVDLVEEGRNGYLFDPSDTPGFEYALRELLGNPDKLRSFRLASRAWAQNFELERIVIQYETLLELASQKEKQ